MSVKWKSEAVMQEIFFGDGSCAEVYGLRHAACCYHAQHRVEEWVIFNRGFVERIRQILPAIHLRIKGFHWMGISCEISVEQP